jgi:hypothetical protein
MFRRFGGPYILQLQGDNNWFQWIMRSHGERERDRQTEREMSVMHRTVEGCLPVTAMKGERKDCTDILHSQYHLAIHFSQFHHSTDEGSTILRNVGTLNNYTVQKSKNNAANRIKAALRTWNNSTETEINWPIKTNDLPFIQSNSAMQINRNVFARTRVALCHAKWIVISIFSLECLPHMRKPGPPCAAIDWHCFLFSSWTIEILLRKVSTNKIISF